MLSLQDKKVYKARGGSSGGGALENDISFETIIIF
jgi:hypothetical protein